MESRPHKENELSQETHRVLKQMVRLAGKQSIKAKIESLNNEKTAKLASRLTGAVVGWVTFGFGQRITEWIAENRELHDQFEELMRKRAELDKKKALGWKKFVEKLEKGNYSGPIIWGEQERKEEEIFKQEFEDWVKRAKERGLWKIEE